LLAGIQMPLHPDLVALQERLVRGGTTAVAVADYLEIRLSLFSTVRVTYDGGQLSVVPFFGFVPRTRATLMTTTIVVLGIPALFILGGITPTNLGFAFLGVLSLVHEATRYVLTESAITRVQMIWDSMAGVDALDAAQTAASARVLGPGGEAAAQHPARASGVRTR
jgi:hypothetical protein